MIEHDSVIDRLELEIDRLSVELLTLRRPVARELRLVISISKITPLLERIADHASSIARAALELNDEPELKNYGELGEMAEMRARNAAGRRSMLLRQTIRKRRAS